MLRSFQLYRDWTRDERSPVFLSPLRRTMSPIVCPTRRESRDRVSFTSILSSRWTGHEAVPSVSVTSEIPDGVTQFPLFALVCHKFYGHFSSDAMCLLLEELRRRWVPPSALDWHRSTKRRHKNWCPVMTKCPNNSKNYAAK